MQATAPCVNIFRYFFPSIYFNGPQYSWAPSFRLRFFDSTLLLSFSALQPKTPDDALRIAI